MTALGGGRGREGRGDKGQAPVQAQPGHGVKIWSFPIPHLGLSRSPFATYSDS